MLVSAWIMSRFVQEKKLKGLIESVGAKLVYLSTYSSEFSPIESFWSKVKARTYKDLISSLGDTMLKAIENDIYN